MHKTLKLICSHAEMDKHGRHGHRVHEVHDHGFLKKLRMLRDVRFDGNYGVLNGILHLLKTVKANSRATDEP